MSVVTGKPARRLTASSVFNPSCKPGPRNVEPDDRFALSNEALKINGTRSSSLSSRRRSAMLNVNSCDSITHGPAIHNSGKPDPQRTGPMVTISLWTMAILPDQDNERFMGPRLARPPRFCLAQARVSPAPRPECPLPRAEPAGSDRAYLLARCESRRALQGAAPT